MSHTPLTTAAPLALVAVLFLAQFSRGDIQSSPDNSPVAMSPRPAAQQEEIELAKKYIRQHEALEKIKSKEKEGSQKIEESLRELRSVRTALAKTLANNLALETKELIERRATQSASILEKALREAEKAVEDLMKDLSTDQETIEEKPVKTPQHEGEKI